MKLKNEPTFVASPVPNQPWLGYVRFYTEYGDKRFDHIKDAVKSIPGARYEPDRKQWVVPEEMIDRLEILARNMGFVVIEE